MIPENFQEDMLSLLTTGHSADPDGYIGKLYGLIGRRFDRARENLRLIGLWRDIDQARGDALTGIGINYGVARKNDDDDFFRILIKVKMMAQLRGCNTNSIIQALSTLLEADPSFVKIRDVYPAKIHVTINRDTIPEKLLSYIERIAEVFGWLVAAGVGALLIVRDEIQLEARIHLNTATVQYTRLKLGLGQHKQRHKAPVTLNTATVLYTRMALHVGDSTVRQTATNYAGAAVVNETIVEARREE